MGVEYLPLITFLSPNISLQLKISKIFNETDYKVSFIDNSAFNSWNNYLYIDSSYYLADNMNINNTHAEIIGRNPVFNNTITLNSNNNIFTFKPYYNGKPYYKSLVNLQEKIKNTLIMK